MQHTIVCKQTQVHCAFPTLTRMMNGELLVFFRQAPVRADATQVRQSGARTHYHLDPRSRIVVMRSRDEGTSWETETVVCPSVPERDLNYAVGTQLSSGELLVLQHRWYVLAPEREAQVAQLREQRRLLLSYGDNYAAFGAVLYDALYQTRSVDGGIGWSMPTPVAMGPLSWCTHTGTRGPLELADGSLLVALHGRCRGDRNDRIFVARSVDAGRSWSHAITVAWDPEGKVGFHEPAMARLPSGRLLMLLRSDGGEGLLYRVFSDDDGWTWQGLEATGIWGHPASVVVLRDGRVMCTYGYRREPFGVRACVSLDGGLSWTTEQEKVVRDDGLDWDLGYPSSIERSDGRILTVYYFHGSDEIRHIASTVHEV